MSDVSENITERLGALIAALEPARRRELAKQIAKDLRTSTQQRIRKQQNPDGSTYPPRKPQPRALPGRIRRGAMFRKIAGNQWLKAESTAKQASVGFAGRVTRIATVHQEGRVDRVRRGGPDVAYPARRLLGFTAQELDHINDLIIAHLAK